MSAVRCFFLFLSLLLTACGGGGGSSSERDANLDGVWVGSFYEEGVAYDLHALIYENKVYAYSERGDTFYEGRLFSKGSKVSGTIDIYQLGGGFFDETSISGIIVEQDRITAKVDSGATLDLIYDDIFERPSSLNMVSGIWTMTVGSDTTTIVVGSDGVVDGSDSDGCIYSGSIKTPDINRNIYKLNLIVSNCGSFSGPATGYATLSDFTDQNDSFIFAFSGANAIFIGGLMKN